MLKYLLIVSLLILFLMLFFSPHNPVGRSYTTEELLIIGKLCIKHKVTIISDEIHWDLIVGAKEGKKHIPIASLSKEIGDITGTDMFMFLYSSIIICIRTYVCFFQ
jgi:bifunctional pyridoxal-dependent enzyme with beta-cystathionase and maltose regulon repressor activities